MGQLSQCHTSNYYFCSIVWYWKIKMDWFYHPCHYGKILFFFKFFLIGTAVPLSHISDTNCNRSPTVTGVTPWQIISVTPQIVNIFFFKLFDWDSCPTVTQLVSQICDSGTAVPIKSLKKKLTYRCLTKMICHGVTPLTIGLLPQFDSCHNRTPVSMGLHCHTISVTFEQK